jgi:ferrous iron transport protein B
MMRNTERRCIALIGNPNTGKTTLFNALTGLRQKTGNYAGVTVEKKEGILLNDDGSTALLLDLPGTYSLTSTSPDQDIAVGVLLGRLHDVPSPDLVVCVVDASNLERNLYLVSQIIDFHLPVVIALTMMDAAEKEHITIDPEAMRRALGVPVVPVIVSKNIGLTQLRNTIIRHTGASLAARKWAIPDQIRTECIGALSSLLQHRRGLSEPQAFQQSLTLLTSTLPADEQPDGYDAELVVALKHGRERIDASGLDRSSFLIEARYEWIGEICSQVRKNGLSRRRNFIDTLDAICTHGIGGYAIFLTLMFFGFQSVFTWSEAPMNLIGDLFHMIAQWVVALMAAGDFRDLLVDGVIGGAGTVVTFLPQIILLFFFLGILEDSGYMARAAFLMDRLMRAAGLHGKSFVPLMSSFACAIPGIMATRTIENRKDRILTILVAPLMSCSARLPVYTLMIAAFIPQRKLFGVLSLPGLVFVAMYLTGLVAAFLMAWIFRKTLLKSEAPAFILELPPLRIPSPRNIGLQVKQQSWAFLKRAGTFILGVSIILWFLATYPRQDHGAPGERLEHSIAGRAGRMIEPLIKPLGFDWKIGIGLIGSLLQREVFVSTMGTIYNISNSGDEGGASLREKLREDIDPVTGLPVFTTLTAICLMVYYVLAMQCMSTVAVVRRETNGWRWPAFLIGYMTVLAWVGTFLVYRIGLLVS